MLLQLLSLVAGFAALAWFADRFIAGAAGTARSLGVSPLLIGLTIVGMGTSAPEMLVSAIAAWEGAPGLALGNAVGSNITNIALVLGATAAIAPLTVHSGIVRRELPILLGVMAFSLALLWDGRLARFEGALLLLGLAGLMGYLIWQARRGGGEDAIAAEYAEEIPPELPLPRALMWLTVGLIGLLLSSRLLVWAATGIAQALGVSDLVIGLTIVALGTSLPELAASVVSARKNEHDIAVGNVIGSNMFNLLGVIGLAGAIAPASVEPALIVRDYPLMAVLTLVLLLPNRPGGRGVLGRRTGLALLLTYVLYQFVLFGLQ